MRMLPSYRSNSSRQVTSTAADDVVMSSSNNNNSHGSCTNNNNNNNTNSTSTSTCRSGLTSSTSGSTVQHHHHHHHHQFSQQEGNARRRRNQYNRQVSDTSISSDILLLSPPLWSNNNSHLHNSNTLDDNSERAITATAGGGSGGSVPELNWSFSNIHSPTKNVSNTSTKNKDTTTTASNSNSNINKSSNDYHSGAIQKSSKSKTRNRKCATTSLHLKLGHEDHSENADEDSVSFATIETAYFNNSNKKSAQQHRHHYYYYYYFVTNFCSVVNLLQLLVFVALLWCVYESNHRVHEHKQQLAQYDEERAHILEQMMWIDKAAKRVQEIYTNNNNNERLVHPLEKEGGAGILPLLLEENYNQVEEADADDSRKGIVDSSSTTPITSEIKQAEENDVNKVRDLLSQVQLRIQLNDRDRIHDEFGDRPISITLPLTPYSSTDHIVLVLSDDTPHAASTLLQQVHNNNNNNNNNKRLWQQVSVQRLEPSGSIQIRSASSSSNSNGESEDDDTSPMLEFVERSRGCHNVGSVALHQDETADKKHRLTLYVNMEENYKLKENQVCIGRVAAGLDELLEISKA